MDKGAGQGDAKPRSGDAHGINTNPLDGLRIIAAYMVFLFHWMSSPDQWPYLGSFFHEFDSGVTIFFVLSGFLITYIYFDKASLGNSWLSTYYVRRIARLMPMYLLIAVVSLLLIRNHDRFYWFIQLTLLKGFSCEYSLTLVPQAWSLTVEYTFYALAPLIFCFARTRKRLVASIFIAYVMGALLNIIGEPLAFHGFFCDSRFVMDWTFFGRYFEFFVGIYVARFIMTGEGKYMQKIMALKYKSYLGTLVIFASLGFIALLSEKTMGSGIYHAIIFMIHRVIVPCFAGVTLLGLLTEKTLIASTLQSKLFTLLGRTSYVFFLLHIGVIARKILTVVGGDLLLFFIVLNCLSILIFLVFEQPIRDYIRTM
jgi:peptidoglycan/LPS O-acetylase OafA/YrhL